VQQLLADGLSTCKICRTLRLDRKTVQRFARAETVDELLAKARNRGTVLDRVKQYLHERFSAGCTDAARLIEEIATRRLSTPLLDAHLRRSFDRRIAGMRVYVETGAGLHRHDAAGAWTFDLPYWGVVGLGTDEASALAALEVATGHTAETLVVAERVHGNELAFARDREPATTDEFAMTQCLLDAARDETIRLISAASAAELDWRDPARRLPEWARWHTARQLAWHIADVESRYYLTGLGLPARPRVTEIVAELRESHAHVRATLRDLSARLINHHNGTEWTTVKVLRRLAWHEIGELVVLRRLLARARFALQTAD
jgi:hypothetical protein